MNEKATRREAVFAMTLGALGAWGPSAFAADGLLIDHAAVTVALKHGAIRGPRLCAAAQSDERRDLERELQTGLSQSISAGERRRPRIADVRAFVRDRPVYLET